MVAVAAPATDVTTSITTHSVASNTQQIAGRIQILLQNIKDFVERKRQWVIDKIDRFKILSITLSRWAFMFANFMRAFFQFFVIIVLARIVVGFFSKPLEFIMLGLACIILSILYVIYYIFYIQVFIWIPFSIWFIIFDITPLVLFTIIMMALFLVITLFCMILGIINWMTKGSLKSLVLCENHVAAWYKTPNYHLTNKYERGFFCSRQCFTGYYPDSSGMSCVKVSRGVPSYCPQAEVMRMYTSNTSDKIYAFKDYQVNGNLKYLASTPVNREKLLKNYYLKKRDFLEKCEKPMKEFDYMSLGLCSSIDVIDHNGIDPKVINNMKIACAQAFCNSKKNYPFCSLLSGTGEEDPGEFWTKVMKILVLIITFMIIISFILSYTAGVPLE